MSRYLIILKASIIAFISSFDLVCSQSIPGAQLYVGGGVPGGGYQLVDDYQPSTFFSKFNYYNVRLWLDKIEAHDLWFRRATIQPMATSTEFQERGWKKFRLRRSDM